jgi:WD repeat-containing protein 35
MQLMRHDMDDSAVCVDTGIRPSGIKWNHNGSVRSKQQLLAGSAVRVCMGSAVVTVPDSPLTMRRLTLSVLDLLIMLQVLAVTGRQATADGRELWLVQFYSQAGEHLRTMRVPGSGITGLAWEGSGLRLALSVESHIFFTSVRQAPLWGCFAGTIVYAFSKPDRPETCVMFWGTHSNERNTKYVKRVNHICAAGEFCLLVTKVCVWLVQNCQHNGCALPLSAWEGACYRFFCYL